MTHLLARTPFLSSGTCVIADNFDAIHVTVDLVSSHAHLATTYRAMA